MAPASQKPVTAIVVTYQSARTIGRMLAGARRCYDADLLDVIVVDNGSTDATCKLVEAQADWASLIQTGKNNGFGRGNNIGFAQVTSAYTIFINPDAVVEPDAIRTMLRFIEQHPTVGIVGPAIIEESSGQGENASFQFTGQRPTPGSILWGAMPLVGRSAASWPIEPGSAPVRTGWVCGAVFMIRTELLKRLHGFDPRYFLYWEETDVCKRADDINFGTWAVGAALAHHVGGESSSTDNTRIGGCIAKHYYQSRYYYMVKHYGTGVAVVSEMGEFVLLCLRGLADFIRGRGFSRLIPRLQTPLFSKPESAE